MFYTIDCNLHMMKIASLMSANEQIMSDENLYENEDYVADAYADVDEEEEEYGDRTDYR